MLYFLGIIRRTIMARENITFKCSECGEENYIGTRNKRKQTEKMEIQKYCSVCRKKTLHKEKK
jgi:large subunit ribosomal protein L33